MSTDDTEKALAYIREAYVRPPGIFGHYGAEGRGREFDALIARVRRDAAREALDGLAEQYEHDAYIRAYRDAHYPEETP